MMPKPGMGMPDVGHDVQGQLLRLAYSQMPLNMVLSALAALVFTALWWSRFPHALLTVWSLALLGNVLACYLLWAAFGRVQPVAGDLARWEKLFFAQSTAAGAAWALAPILMLQADAGSGAAVLVGLLLSVGGVAVNTLAAQRAAMQGFVVAAVLPPALVSWDVGSSESQMVALSLLSGMLVLLVIGRQSSQTQRELLQSQSRVRAVLDTALDAVIELDAQRRVVEWNRRAEVIFGWSRQEALGSTLEERIGFGRQLQGDGVESLLSTGKEQVLNRRTEITAMRKNGDLFPAELAFTRINTGDSCYFTAFVSDITERKEIQTTLAGANQRLSSLIEAIPDAICFKDGLGRWLITNEPAKQLFRLHSIAWQGKTEVELAALQPGLRAEYEVCLVNDRKAWEAAELTVFLESVFDETGQAHHYEVRKKPVFDDEGERQALVIIGRDVTERRQSEEALRIAAAAFESQLGMIITDASQVIQRVNLAFTEITGYTAQEAVGQTLRLLSSGRHDAAFFAGIAQRIAATGTWQGEVWSRHKSGRVFPEWVTTTAVRDDNGQTTHYVASFSDISASKMAQDQINNLAFYDPLTALPNRRLLMDRLEIAMATSVRRQRKGALLFVDLDNFKTLNDTFGHSQGDLLLEQVAKRLSDCVREGDTVARLGGDEFVVMLEDLSENSLEAVTQAETVGEKMLAVLNRTYQLGSQEYHISPSIGVTLFGGDAQELIGEPLKRADLAMYQAKAAGRNTLCFYDPLMQAVVSARAALEAGLREALDKNQFLLHYQAQVDGNGHVTGSEALVRWQHPQRGVVSPAEFIHLAEETGLILPLGQWVLETACKQLTLWAAQAEMEHLTLAVNVSARQFHQSNFVETVLSTLERTRARPQRLKLELTEGLLLESVEDVISKMTLLKARGIGFSLDDFGTGYSSLAYLKRLPLDQLKIDQGFVRNILTDANDAAIARMVVVLASSLGLAVIAEGVETQEQRDFLSNQGCHAHQGYLFSRPLPVADFEAFARQT